MRYRECKDYFIGLAYIQGNGTKYSMGIGVFACYGLGFLVVQIADVGRILRKQMLHAFRIYRLDGQAVWKKKHFVI